MWRPPLSMAYNGLHCRRRQSSQEAAYAQRDFAANAPTDFGCFDDVARLSSCSFFVAILCITRPCPCGNALLSDAGCPVIQRATGCCPLKFHIVLITSEFVVFHFSQIVHHIIIVTLVINIPKVFTDSRCYSTDKFTCCVNCRPEFFAI